MLILAGSGQELPPGVDVRTPKMASVTPVARKNERASRRSLLRKLNFTNPFMNVTFMKSTKRILAKQVPAPTPPGSNPWMLMEPISTPIQLPRHGSHVSWQLPWSNDKSTLSSSISRASKFTTLPLWATRSTLPLLDLPWVRFHSLLFNLGESSHERTL